MEEPASRRKLCRQRRQASQLLSYGKLSLTVGVQFQWFDTKTGKLVASSEDVRRRNSESNPSSVYNRIIDRFYKNMKDTLEK